MLQRRTTSSGARGAPIQERKSNALTSFTGNEYISNNDMGGKLDFSRVSVIFIHFRLSECRSLAFFSIKAKYFPNVKSRKP